MLPSSEGEFQRGHAVGSHRQRPLHGLPGLLLERTERHGRRTAGREVQSHSLFLVRHGTQTDNHLVVFPRRFQHGDVHGTVVYRIYMIQKRRMVRLSLKWYSYTQPNVNVQPATFQPFSGDLNAITQQENIDLIKDVPLEVTVELGRTSKSIKDILEFAPGTIVELNKIAGEPIDILVNGKNVAKGEVVVIEESFGVRITEIIKDR